MYNSRLRFSHHNVSWCCPRGCGENTTAISWKTASKLQTQSLNGWRGKWIGSCNRSISRILVICPGNSRNASESWIQEMLTVSPIHFGYCMIIQSAKKWVQLSNFNLTLPTSPHKSSSLTTFSGGLNRRDIDPLRQSHGPVMTPAYDPMSISMLEAGVNDIGNTGGFGLNIDQVEAIRSNQ